MRGGLTRPLPGTELSGGLLQQSHTVPGTGLFLHKKRLDARHGNLQPHAENKLWIPRFHRGGYAWPSHNLWQPRRCVCQMRAFFTSHNVHCGALVGLTPPKQRAKKFLYCAASSLYSRSAHAGVHARRHGHSSAEEHATCSISRSRITSWLKSGAGCDVVVAHTSPLVKLRDGVAHGPAAVGAGATWSNPSTADATDRSRCTSM
jgi:hypothetical protein